MISKLTAISGTSIIAFDPGPRQCSGPLGFEGSLRVFTKYKKEKYLLHWMKTGWLMISVIGQAIMRIIMTDNVILGGS